MAETNTRSMKEKTKAKAEAN